MDIEVLPKRNKINGIKKPLTSMGDIIEVSQKCFTKKTIKGIKVAESEIR